MAPHSSTLAWKIPWAEEAGGLQSTGLWRVGHDWATSLSLFTFTFHFHALEKEMATHSSVLAWRIPGMGEPGGLLSMGSHRVGHDWSDLAAVAAVVLPYIDMNQPWVYMCPPSRTPLPPPSPSHPLGCSGLVHWDAIGVFTDSDLNIRKVTWKRLGLPTLADRGRQNLAWFLLP